MKNTDIVEWEGRYSVDFLNGIKRECRSSRASKYMGNIADQMTYSHNTKKTYRGIVREAEDNLQANPAFSTGGVAHRSDLWEASDAIRDILFETDFEDLPLRMAINRSAFKDLVRYRLERGE